MASANSFLLSSAVTATSSGVQYMGRRSPVDTVPANVVNAPKVLLRGPLKPYPPAVRPRPAFVLR